jgi:hypothetical protein
MALLAGDIGGTKTTLVLCASESRLVSSKQSTYLSGEYPSVAAVASEFMDGAKAPIDRAVFGVAGPVIGGRALATNLPWDMTEVHLCEALGIGEVKLLNDLEATAYGVPHRFFPPSAEERIMPNVLSLCLQPDDGIHLRFEAKKPGAGMRTRPVDLEFHYVEDFGAASSPEAYEHMPLDAMQADATLFTRADGLELTWALTDPILARWKERDAAPLVFFEPGGLGPAEGDLLLGEGKRAWHLGCGGHDR